MEKPKLNYPYPTENEKIKSTKKAHHVCILFSSVLDCF